MYSTGEKEEGKSHCKIVKWNSFSDDDLVGKKYGLKQRKIHNCAWHQH